MKLLSVKFSRSLVQNELWWLAVESNKETWTKITHLKSFGMVLSYMKVSCFTQIRQWLHTKPPTHITLHHIIHTPLHTRHISSLPWSRLFFFARSCRKIVFHEVWTRQHQCGKEGNRMWTGFWEIFKVSRGRQDTELCYKSPETRNQLELGFLSCSISFQCRVLSLRCPSHCTDILFRSLWFEEASTCKVTAPDITPKHMCGATEATHVIRSQVNLHTLRNLHVI